MGILSAIMTVLGILCLGGIPLLFLTFLAFMGLTPLYVAQVIPLIGIALLLAIGLSLTRRLSSKGIKRMWLGFLALCLLCGGYVGYGYYKDSIPTRDDRDFMLYDYAPFAENTKAVSLDAPASLQFDDAVLRMDGSTALYPIYASFVQAVYPEGEYRLYANTEDGLGRVTCTGTIEAYNRLIGGHTDIIFCAAPSQDQLDAAKAAGVELHMTPIGREAFVFFVNNRNPVASLTVEQIQQIYTGKITNWSEVGGKSQSIRPFQRAENSGSQSALLRLMDGLPLIEPTREDRLSGMGEIISEVAAYRNYKNALGYSFRFYATEMDGSDEIKLLAIDDIAPTRETIRDGSYPITSTFYAITASPIGQPPAPKVSAYTKALIDWILSPEGQQIIEDVGYVALQ